MLDLLVQAPGMTVSALASHFTMSRIAVTKHLKALEAAGLVQSEKHGRTRHLFLDPSRSGDQQDDSFVFSHSFERIGYGQTRDTFAQLSPGWRPSS